jgi:hypothetical protein
MPWGPRRVQRCCKASHHRLVAGMGERARVACLWMIPMLLEELASESVGLERQFLDQIVPSRAGRISRGPRHWAGQRGLGGSSRSDLWGRSRFCIGRGWVSLKARNSELACRARSCRKNGESRTGWALFAEATPSETSGSEVRHPGPGCVAQKTIHPRPGKRQPGDPSEWSVLWLLA